MYIKRMFFEGRKTKEEGSEPNVDGKKDKKIFRLHFLNLFAQD
jgi:hypothetical protein